MGKSWAIVPLFASVVLFTACARQPASIGSKIPGTREEAIKSIRELIPEASGIPAEVFARIATSSDPPVAAFHRSQPLTFGLWSFKILPQVDGLAEAMKPRKEEFAIVANRPNALSEELERSGPLGYGTLLQADSIKDITCEISGATATGVIIFEAPEVCRGKVEYTAIYDEGQWSIAEFRLPVRRWTFRRVEADRWEWTDRFGSWFDRDRLPPEQMVNGHIEFNGQPAPDARLRFASLDAPDTFDSFVPRTDENGDFSTRLRPGRWGYDVRCSKLKVGWYNERPNYRLRDGSKQILEVKEGENHFVIDLVSNDESQD
jgi:hypothetical protein